MESHPPSSQAWYVNSFFYSGSGFSCFLLFVSRGSFTSLPQGFDLFSPLL
ncbi:hypothetical protein PDIG_72480 [Penicillium digitatum PHI26]|uniref:Uncharacterized protein n=2 Tax=Penicillium digitatum TaxID=36651 RepID=K9FH01_PEND2|nr:hypothetical protein PDIP_42960 [Penicillium digitatum Pd1]EKV07387.1 hypothetical protein PDIG_72480 [Penicillium digitatum PHI26]EKV14600.1 hypothetical protein PDIP_42960 [Penicillium digitatum Pd1]